jgi:hypothetical protein
MQIEQILIRPQSHVMVALVRDSLGRPDNFSVAFEDLDDPPRWAVTKVVDTLTHQAPADVDPAVLTEIQELEARLAALKQANRV